MKGDIIGFRNYAIKSFLSNFVQLEPLNLFLYTWRFLSQLEREESNIFVQKTYHWLALVLIVLLPVSFYCLVPAYILENAMVDYNVVQLKEKEAQHSENVAR